MSFTGKVSVENEEKNEIIRKYLEIASKYCDIVFDSVDKPTQVVCNICKNKKNFDVDGNMYICVVCGAQKEILYYMSSYKDVDRVNISLKFTYDRKIHFKDCMNQYQAKQNCTIHEDVYKQLEEQFKAHHLLVGDKNTKREIRFSKIKKEHILMFLRELKYNKHYENINLIHYNFTGIKPDDISHLEDALLNDFDELTLLYDKHFKNKITRTNFVNTQNVLYQLLRRHGHPCSKDDFAVLKTIDRQFFHDNIVGELFQILGWNYDRFI
jgi:hypothetical protein